MIPYRYFILFSALFVFLSCGEREAEEKSDDLPDIFPDYIGVTVPDGIAPLNFGVEGATHIQAVVRSEKSEMTAIGSDHVEFDIDDWHYLLADALKLNITVSVWNDVHPDGVEYKAFEIQVSKDSIDPWIAYRLIPPGYEGWNKMGIYQRNLTGFEELTVVDNTDNGRGCVNCHNACNSDPDLFTLHSRGEYGGTLIQRNGKLECINLKNFAPGLQGSYNAWHPSGRYIAFSSNTTVQSFFAKSREKIEAYDLRGDLIVYDVEKKEVKWDERFTDSLNLESFPTFSPDGKWLYFETMKPVDMPVEYEKLKYSIVRVPFDPETASLGEVDTIFSAYEKNRTAIIPKISPDGRYMMYSTAPCGAMNLYHIDSDLALMDLQTREELDCSVINSDDSESYHVWSTNGRWVIFSSKRIDGRFTRLFITHWDGHSWTKPFLLPQQDPKQNTLLMMAYNLPEFLVKPINISRSEFRELIGYEK